MVLRAGYAVLALKLQEAASGDLSANDIRSRLSDAINDAHRGTGKWAYYIDHFGDSNSGDVVFCCDGDTRKAPYEISDTGGAAKCVIDMEHAEDVVPRTVYEPEVDEDDHYAAMEEAYKAEGWSGMPMYERFISKSERKAASADDFAGSGRSFPILKAEDVSAAAHALGRAGSKNKGTSAIKAAIIRIAKRKGWASKLPKAWQDSEGDSAKESARAEIERRQYEAAQEGSVNLVESAATVEAIVLREARADYEIKLIAPGKGSSAYYPAAVLQRDGPKVFKQGTHVYLNHPTQAEEAARPEGDVTNLAGVLTTDAAYHETHAKGPGLYARMKVFADHAATVEEKAPHVGMSIRANGVAESGRKQDGLPVLKELTAATSVDVVTRAGAGGMILTEAARAAQEVSMPDNGEYQKLQEAVAAQSALNQRLLERAIRGDARDEGARLLASVTLPAAAKLKVIEACIERGIPTKDGELDKAKFQEAITAEAQSMGRFLGELTGAGQVRGMGVAPVDTDPVKLAEAKKRRADEDTELRESAESIFGRIMGDKDAAKAAARGMVA